MIVTEKIISGACEPDAAFLPHVALRSFVSAKCGARAMATGSVTFAPGER